MRRDSPRRQRRIRDIARQITLLSDELRSLLLEDEFDNFPEVPRAPSPPRVPTPPQVPTPPRFRRRSPSPPPRSLNPASTGFFQTDDRVQILNSRNGLRGHQGTVSHTNDRFVYFRLDSTGDIVWRSARNLRRIHPPP